MMSAIATPHFSIARRRFLQSVPAMLALQALGQDGPDLVNQKPKRVA